MYLKILVYLDAVVQVRRPLTRLQKLVIMDITRNLTNGYIKVKDAKWKIMVCHTPPKDTAIDVIRSGLHVGSSVVRDFIVQYKPDVCISGHIHESRARDKVGDTIVLNAGMFRDGWYIEVDVDKGGISAVLKSVA